MASQVPVSPRHSDVDYQHCNTFHGQGTDGRIRVKLQGQKYLVTGALSECRLAIDASGQRKSSCTLIVTTPGYQASATNDKNVIAYCAKTGKSYRVVGLFKKLIAKPLVLSNPVAEASPADLRVETEQAQNQVAGKAQVCDPGAQRLFQRHFEVIAAQRAAGLDPDLRMSFIPAFLGESKANLYRKMGKEFPLPIKRGKGSFWPMSQIEAYKAGRLIGVESC